MSEVVTIDYFPLTDVFDFGFTPTRPWSVPFADLKYETVNFLEGMGSIALFFWIGALLLICVGVYWLFRHSCQHWLIKKLFSPLTAWVVTLSFLQGTFFEVMISSSISFRMFEIYEYLNAADKFSIANQLLVLIVMTLFCSLIIYFTIFRMPKLCGIYRVKSLTKNKARLQTVRE